MKRFQIIFSFILVVSVMLSGCELTRSGDSQPPEPVTEPDGTSAIFDDSSRAVVPSSDILFAQGQALIKFTAETLPELPKKKKEDPDGIAIGSASLDPLFRELGITELEPLLAPVAEIRSQSVDEIDAGTINQIFVAEFDETQSVEDTIDKISQNEKVEYVEPNYIAYASEEGFAIQNSQSVDDPYFQYQWNLEAIQVPQAWQMSTGEGVIVAVLDTGIAYETYDMFVQAPDLAGTNFVAGYDFVNDDPHPNDDQGHGTHVAGTIAQTTNNGKGVASVAYNATVMPIKVLDLSGQGSYAGIIQGITYAVGNGADIINLSLSGRAISQALKEAIDQAYANGVIVVAAAGNSNSAVEYPAAFENVIAVGAMDIKETRAKYSNFGPELDIIAPGGDNSTDINQDGLGDGIVQQTFKNGQYSIFKYAFMEGTSMATPHVSGVIALMLAANPDANPEQIKSILVSTAKNIGDANHFGAGLIQASDAISMLTGVEPTPIDKVTATVPTESSTEVPVPTEETPIETPTGEPTSVPVQPTYTPQPVTPVAGNIIVNSSFEDDMGWVFETTRQTGRYTTDKAHSGNRSVVVGITDSNADQFAYSSVRQQITLPAHANKITLNVHTMPVSFDIPSSDVQLILLLNQHDRVEEHLYQALSNQQHWQLHTFDLTQYKGNTMTIYFGAINNIANGKPTSLYLDDVSLIVE